jgi:hypothetical protein
MMKTYQAPKKQSTQKRGKERYKMDRPKSRQKEETTNEGRIGGQVAKGT